MDGENIIFVANSTLEKKTISYCLKIRVLHLGQAESKLKKLIPHIVHRKGGWGETV